MRIDLQRIIANPNGRVVVATGGGTLAQGFINTEISLAGQSSFQSLLESQAQAQLAITAARAKAVAGGVGYGGYVPNVSPIALEQSVASWTGTNKPTFTLHLIFPALTEADDVTEPVSNLYTTVFPTAVKVGKATFLRPPLNYAPTGETATGTITVTVGTFLRMTGQIMTNVDFSFSKQCIQSGQPLYASGTISFEPYRMLTIDDVKGYFI